MHTSANTCRERTGVGGANDHDTRAAHAGRAFGAQTLAPLLQVPVQVGVGFHLLHLALVDPFGLPANGYRRASPRVDLLTLLQSAPAHRTDAPSPERLRYGLRIAAKLEGVCGGGGVKERRRTASLVLKSLRDSPRGTSAPKISARPVSRVTVTTLSSTSSRSSSPASSTNVCFRHVVFSQSHCPSLPRKHARRAIHGHTHATPRHTHRERERHSHTSFLACSSQNHQRLGKRFGLYS